MLLLMVASPYLQLVNMLSRQPCPQLAGQLSAGLPQHLRFNHKDSAGHLCGRATWWCILKLMVTPLNPLGNHAAASWAAGPPARSPVGD
jgi:hypothetical protein